MKKFLMIFLLIAIAGFLRGSPNVVQNSDENTGNQSVTSENVTVSADANQEVVVIAVENSSVNSAVITRDAKNATESQANLSQLNEEVIMISIPLGSQGLVLNRELGIRWENDVSPPVAVSSSFSYDANMDARFNQIVPEVAYNVIWPISNLGVNVSSESAAIDLEKLDAAEVQYTSKAELCGTNLRPSASSEISIEGISGSQFG